MIALFGFLSFCFAVADVQVTDIHPVAVVSFQLSYCSVAVVADAEITTAVNANSFLRVKPLSIHTLKINSSKDKSASLTCA